MDWRPCPDCDCWLSPAVEAPTTLRAVDYDGSDTTVTVRRWVCACGHFFTLED